MFDAPINIKSACYQADFFGRQGLEMPCLRDTNEELSAFRGIACFVPISLFDTLAAFSPRMMYFCINTFLPCLLYESSLDSCIISFLLCTVLPIYLARIRARYLSFWFNTLPIGMGSFWGTLIHRAYFGKDDFGFLGIAVLLGSMVGIIVLNVAFIHLAYKLIFKENIDFNTR